MVEEPADKVIPNIFILHLRGCPDSTPWDTTISHAALTLIYKMKAVSKRQLAREAECFSTSL